MERHMTGSTFELAVVVNCYNYAEYVERAINSVLMQKRGDCEIIVVDDGSTDASWEVIERTGVKAYRIENSGQRRACVFGLDQTTAPFVLFLDADDELAPGALDAIIPHLQPCVAKVQFCLSRVDSDNKLLGSAVPDPRADTPGRRSQGARSQNRSLCQPADFRKCVQARSLRLVAGRRLRRCRRWGHHPCGPFFRRGCFAAQRARALPRP
jgi:glycosyltransferase involved in cell wall biosynthesis